MTYKLLVPMDCFREAGAGGSNPLTPTNLYSINFFFPLRDFPHYRLLGALPVRFVQDPG